MTREKVETAIREMPLEFDVEELIERLLFIEKVEIARKEIKDGKSFTHSEAKNIIDTWGR